MAARKWTRLLVPLLVLAALLPMAQPVHAEDGQRLTTERQVYAFLTSKMGLSSAAACGVMANIEVESGFSLTALGDSGSSFGLCQWHEDRYASLRAYCTMRGRDYRSLMGQLEYLHYELRVNYPDLYAQLRMTEDSAQGAYLAAYLWCVRFERPADMEAKGAERGSLAQNKYWPRYHGISVPDPVADGSIARQVLNESFGVGFDGSYITSSTGVVHEWRLETDTEEQSSAQQNGHTQAHRSVIRAYTPHHRPAASQKGSASVGISVGLNFFVLGDGTERRRVCMLEETVEENPAPAA